jgi:hypothetical protein
MKAAAAVAALAEMGVLLRPLEAPGAVGVEVLVEMVEMSQPVKAAAAVVEAWDPAPTKDRSRMGGLEAMIRKRDLVEMVMVPILRSPQVLAPEATLEEPLRAAAAAETLQLHLMAAAAVEALDFLECSLKAAHHREMKFYLPEAMEEMGAAEAEAESY